MSHMSVIPCRTAVAGARLELMVLAAEPRGCIGVDLESGALVRASHPPADAPLAPFDLAEGEIAPGESPLDLSRPESVQLSAPPERRGTIPPRRAERWLRALRHPDRLPLLGFGGATVPYWTLAGDRPSVALVDLALAPSVGWSPPGFRCRFRWRGAAYELPLADRRLPPPPGHRSHRYSSRQLYAVLGYHPQRLLVALSPPRAGICYKLVAALLPKP